MEIIISSNVKFYITVLVQKYIINYTVVRKCFINTCRCYIDKYKLQNSAGYQFFCFVFCCNKIYIDYTVLLLHNTTNKM